MIPSEIRLGFRFDFHFDEGEFVGDGFGWHPQSLHTFFSEFHTDATIAQPISTSDLNLVSEIYATLKNLPHDCEHTARAFKRFNSLCSVSKYSELAVIGLFSVIESLITHAPKLTESADSLSHQLRSKIPLVRKRFARTLDQASYFDDVSEENLWSRLYDYRGAIVHGEHATFGGKSQVLRDIRAVVDFLRETTKLLLIGSLREPVLMRDLKRC